MLLYLQTEQWYRRKRQNNSSTEKQKFTHCQTDIEQQVIKSLINHHTGNSRPVTQLTSRHRINVYHNIFEGNIFQSHQNVFTLFQQLKILI